MTRAHSLIVAGLLVAGAAGFFAYSRMSRQAPEAPAQEAATAAGAREAAPDRMPMQLEPPPAGPSALPQGSTRAPATIRHDIPEPPPRRERHTQPTEPPPELPDYLRNNPPPMRLPDNLPKPEELREHFLLLQRFLELPPESLARIRESIERIERMPPERKKMMLERIRGVSFPAPVNASTQLASKELEARAEAAIKALPREAQTKVRAKIAELEPEQRAAFLEGLSLQHELSGTLEDRLFSVPAGN